MESITDRTPVYCADCGLQILDIQDIDYTVDAVGNVLTVSHTAEFHREMAVDEMPDANAGMHNIPNPSLASRKDILVWAHTAGLEALRAWLKWNDPNGDYDDTPESLETYGPFTRDDALRNITEQVESI